MVGTPLVNQKKPARPWLTALALCLTACCATVTSARTHAAGLVSGPVLAGASRRSAPFVRKVRPNQAQPAQSTALLTNGIGDGTVAVRVDAYGAFGSESGAGDLFFDPPGPEEALGTVFLSRTAFSGISDGGAPARPTFLDERSLGPGVFTQVSSNSAESEFRVNGVRFRLIQQLLAPSGGGSSLRQTYQVTNETAAPVSFDLIRLLDADLEFDGSEADTAVVLAGGQQVLTFDRSLGPDQSSAFVGSDLNGQANLGFQVEESPRPDVLNGRAALTNTIRRDGVNVDVNGDGISDTPFDIATAQGQAFTLNPGESAVYDVGTTVGENQPSDIQSAPSNLEATAVSDSEIRLRFVDNSVNETGFEVERQADFGPFSLLTVLDADDVTYRDTGLAEGVTYTYRVRARLAGGRTTADSNEAEATTMLRAPTGLDAIATSPTTVTLAWSDNSDAESGYIIERCTLDGPFEVIDSTGPNESSYQDFDLTPDTTYCYRVKAFGAGSESDYSNVVFVTTSDAAPEAPTNLRASLAGAVTVVLSWEDNSASEEGFNIERRTEDGDFGLIDTVNADVTQYIDTGLTPGTTYVYRVQAFSSGGESEFSNEASVTTAGGGTAGPEDLRVTGVCETIIFVEWEDVSEDESGFEIERRSGNEDFERVGRVGADVTRFTDTGLARSTRYTYRVRAVRGNSFSEFSNEDSGATLSGVSGGTAQITPRKLSFSRNAGAKPLTKQVVIKNVGKQTLAGVVYKLSAPYKILSGAGGFALKPGKSLTVTVEFTPGVSGKTSSSLTVYSTDRKTSLVDVPVALQK